MKKFAILLKKTLFNKNRFGINTGTNINCKWLQQWLSNFSTHQNSGGPLKQTNESHSRDSDSGCVEEGVLRIWTLDKFPGDTDASGMTTILLELLD